MAENDFTAQRNAFFLFLLTWPVSADILLGPLYFHQGYAT